MLKIAFLLAFIVADPFGLQRAALEASRRVTDRLGAMVYAAPSGNLVRVVLVDDAALPSQGWPPSLDFWGNLIERIAEAEPRAIFLDVELRLERPPAGDFDTLLRPGADPGGMPRAPLVAADSGRAAVLRGQRTDCDAAPAVPIAGVAAETIGADPARRAASPLLHRLACGASGLAFYDWAPQSDPRAYPLWIRHDPRPFDPPAARGVEGPSAALALAQIVCANPPEPKPAWCAAPLDAAAARALPPMIPRWALASALAEPDRGVPPTLTPAQVLDGLTSGCVLYEPVGPLGRLARLAEVLVIEAFSGVLKYLKTWPSLHLDGREATDAPDGPGAADRPRIAKAPCPHPAPVNGGAEPGGLPAETKALLAGTVVLIGDARATSPDRVASPLHGTLPGVFLHAVALENLLTSGRNYTPIQEKVPGSTVEYGKIADWVLKAVSILLAFGLAWWRDLPGRTPVAAPPGMGWIAVSATLPSGSLPLGMLIAGLLAAGVLAGVLLPPWGALGVVATLALLAWLRPGSLVMALLSLALLLAGVLVIYSLPTWWGPALLAAFVALLCWRGRAPGGREAEADDATRRRLTRQFRLVVMLVVLAGLGIAAAIGWPSSNPLVVILVALAVAIPVIDQSPLESH